MTGFAPALFASAVLAPALLLLTVGAALAQPACPARGNPAVSVTLHDPDPRLASPLPAAQLRQMADGEEAEVLAGCQGWWWRRSLLDIY